MAVYTFPGGIKLPEDKNVRMKKCRIRALPMPKRLVLPLNAFGGRLCKPFVKPGAPVLVGQRIAEDDGGSYLLHSPVSGTVKGILQATEDRAPALLLENDFKDRRDRSLSPFGKTLFKASDEEMLDVIRRAGIPLFSEGGASLFDRLTALLGNAKTVIVNGVRREPWITGGYRLLLENPGAVIGGLKILLKLLSVREALLVLEENCKEAARAVSEIAFDSALLKTVFIKSKYPGYQERPLVYAATGKALPRGKRAEEAGILVIDPESLAAVYQAFVNGMPVIRRILTVGGESTVTPGNYFVPLGMSLFSLADFLKKEKETPTAALGEYTAVLGGRMNGVCLPLKNQFVTKETAAVYLQKETQADPEGECIRCGRCMTVCPVGLPPIVVYRAVKEGKTEDALRFGGDCIGCGCCSRVCPGGVSLYRTVFGWKEDRFAVAGKADRKPEDANVREDPEISEDGEEVKFDGSGKDAFLTPAEDASENPEEKENREL